VLQAIFIGNDTFNKEKIPMKPFKILYLSMIALLMVSSAASAGSDFAWMRDFNIKAEADPSGLRARLEARFRVGAARINMVLGNVEKPADAYMCLRLGEMSHQPVEHVIEKYKAGKGKGWGTLARSLGIKPGSKDFHALKQGQDLYDDRGRDNDSVKSKGKSTGKGKGKK